MDFDELRDNFSINCKAERKRLGLSQDEFASRLHMEQSSISKWEKQKVIPDVFTLLQVANLFKCSIDELIGRNWQELQKKQPEQVELKTADVLTDKQKELLDIIKHLKDDDINKIIGYAYSLNEKEITTEEKIEKLLKEYKNKN